MRRYRILPAVAIVAALSLTLAACGGDDDDSAESASPSAPTEQVAAAEPGTIVEVASASEEFETLVAAVQAAGLVDTLSGDGPFTVFAPTDDAFATALTDLGVTAEELLADTDLLTSILTYHVLPAEVPSTAITPGTAMTVNGATVELATEGGVTVNGISVVTADVEASNGVIHVIDGVLLPPDDGETIVDIASASTDFETLVAAADAAGLVETLAGPGPYTVLAPIDDAFTLALDELGLTAEELLADTELLTSILTYHVVPGEIFAADFVAGPLTTVNGADVNVTRDGTNVFVNNIHIVQPDLDASNGVIQVIDRVLVPPAS
jgi:uncharacterized surface protein with fasciclin (FAS1) repeats